jgi:glucose/arabinose dehydrogenase
MRCTPLACLLAALAPATPAAAEITNAPAAPRTEIKVTSVARGLEHPWGLAFLPDGRPIVTERPGRVRIVGADGKLSAPLDGVPAVHAEGQGGLLDIALAPDFASSSRLYLSFAERRENGRSATAVARAKLVLDGAGGRLEGLDVIFRQEPAVASDFHFGSRLVFAGDGSLFITTGDRGSMRAAVQDPRVPIGKVIHVDKHGNAIGAPRAPGWDPRVHSIGHRNIQGAAIDPATGQLWTVEHGARGGDELNRPEAGRNYGWPIITYGRDYSGARIGEGTSKPGLEQPVYYWDPSIATSGLAIYAGSLFTGWKGNLLVGGLAGARLARLVVENGTVVAEEKLLGDRGDRIRDVRQGPDGAVYVLTDDARGELLRISPRAP